MSKIVRDEVLELLKKKKRDLTYEDLGKIVSTAHTMIAAVAPLAHISKKYSLNVNYGLSMKEYVRLGNYKELFDGVSGLYLPSEKKGFKKVDFFLLGPEGCKLYDFEDFMREKGLRHATARELLTFYATYKSHLPSTMSHTEAHGTHFNGKVLSVREMSGSRVLELVNAVSDFYNHYDEFACVKI